MLARLTAAFAAGRIGGPVSIWIIGAKAWAGLDALSLVSALGPPSCGGSPPHEGGTIPVDGHRRAIGGKSRRSVIVRAYSMVGMTKSAPARMPVGQRVVMVLRRV